jgi:hypothetical protein
MTLEDDLNEEKHIRNIPGKDLFGKSINYQDVVERSPTAWKEVIEIFDRAVAVDREHKYNAKKRNY